MTMIFCHACSKEILDSASHCSECGAPQTAKILTRTQTLAPKPALEPLPAGIKGWCWGGFLLNFIWGIRFRIWWGLLALIPLVGIGVSIWFGFKGRELAWRQGNWASVEEFNRTQRRWSIAGMVFVVTAVAISLLMEVSKETRFSSPPSNEIAAGIDLSFPQKTLHQEPPAQESATPIQEHVQDDVVLANIDKEGVDLLETRYGHLTANEHSQLVLGSRLVKPAIQANSSLSIKESFRIGDDDLVIIENRGGTACPALFNFVLIGANGARSYPTFGTCSDIYQAEHSGNAVAVTMQGESNLPYRYLFSDGVLTENGKKIQPQPVRNFSVEAVIEDIDGYTNIRAQPNGQSAVIGRVKMGESFQTHPQNSEWWKVKMIDGSTGFIHRSRIVLLQKRF